MPDLRSSRLRTRPLSFSTPHSLSRAPLSNPMPPCLSVPHRTLDPPHAPKTFIDQTAPESETSSHLPIHTSADRPRSLPCIIIARIQERAAQRLLVTGQLTRSWALTRRHAARAIGRHICTFDIGGKRATATPLRQESSASWLGGDQLVSVMAVARSPPEKHCAQLLSHEDERGRRVLFVLVLSRLGKLDCW
jgi:hypothetical protein